MKKVYAKLAGRKLNFFRPFYKTSFVKMFSLSSIVALLSSASPVYSKTVAPKEAFLISAKSSSIVFPQSVISVYDDYNVDASDQENYVTVLQGENTLAASAVSDYVNFLINTLSKKSNDNAIINILTVYNSFARVIGYGSDLGLWGTSSLLEENYPTKFKVETFGDISTRDTGDPDPDRPYQAGDQASAGGKNAIAIGYTAKARDKDNIAIGARAEAKGYSSVAIGSEYTVQDPTEHTSAIDDYTTAVGAIAMSTKFGASSFGHRSYATNKEALSLGFKSVANVETSVALGAESVANIAAGVAGYAPLLQGKSTDSEIAWKSTMGAVSVGYVAWKKTRQITAVAAGFEDTDAVNVAQLKSLQGYVNKGWKLSVDDKNATVVSIDDTVDFSAGSNNFTITKGEDNNNVKFDLAKSITVDKIETGNNTLDATGLVISSGPKITTAGIDAGSKKITGVEKGTDANDAVNFSQLKEIKEQVASSGLVAQDAQTKDITIGKEADGDKIDILNNKGKNRILSGITNGTISDASTEAITGQQLYQLGTSIAGSLGGGASFSGGTWTAPKFKVKTVKADGKEGEETVYDDVAAALSGVGNSFKDIHKEIKNEITNVVTKVEGDSLSWSKEANAFVARHEKSTEEGKSVRMQENSKITFLANGSISKNSSDAMNGSQLYALCDTFATYLGGGAKYEEGKWTAPSFKVKTVKDDGSDVEDKEYKTVAEALAGVGTSITNVKKEISSEITNVVSDNLVKQDEASKIIKIGAEKDGPEITIVSNEGANRTLSGLKEATKNNEAVNKGQLDESLKKLSTSLQSDESAVVHYDKKEGDEIDYTNVIFGKGKDSTPVGLHNVADGKIAENSHDVVTGGQINKIGGDIAKFLGGEASFKDGALTQPTYKLSQIAKDGVVTENSFNDVGVAFGGLDTNIKNVNQRIKEVSENIVQDSLSWSKEDDAFVAKHGAEKIASKIKFVAGGDLSENSTDAVNGGQLFKTNERVSAVENQVSNIDKQVKDIATVADGAVKYDQDGEGHKVNKITLVGVNESDPVLIDNVGNGKIESGSKEAVNGGQLHDYTEQQTKIVLDDAQKYTDEKASSIINNAADEAKSYTDMKFGTLSYAVQDIRKEARQAAAIGLAVANLSYDDTPGKLSVTFGSGVWRNQSAFALGAGYMSENGRMRSNLSVTSAGGHWGVGAGFRVTLN
ncbi:YadA-like family protein [Bartonella taylorii]|uniref:YadA-like family protein n=1 Tax=Bartonella taylorii TaxID=33046 RepID=UPI001ABA0B96|nr:YadA-like family protein [Bartonella taylorii]